MLSILQSILSLSCLFVIAWNRERDGVMAQTLSGSYLVNNGVFWTNNPPTYTCQQACAYIFGGSSSQYSGSLSSGSISRTCFVSVYAQSCITAADTYSVCTSYSTSGCASAYVGDLCSQSQTNYCWLISGTATSATPTRAPSRSPSRAPTISPSRAPTRLPSFSLVPTAVPTRPTCQPTPRPTTPTGQPSSSPSSKPSLQPLSSPTAQPVSSPTTRPSTQPTSQPSTPTTPPSVAPSSRPSKQPSSRPTKQPSRQPSSHPSSQPSLAPTQPTSQPSSQPSGRPTSHPSGVPPCPAGTFYQFVSFSTNPLGYVCIPCSPGYYSLGSADSCDACPEGSYTAVNESSSCQLCPLNSYANTLGSSGCKSCPQSFVTGSTGSISKAQCVNAVVNFVFGGVCLLFALFFIYIYLYRGRLLRIAFHRRFILVRKSVITAGAAARAADLASTVSTIISTIIRKSKEAAGYKKYTKPLLFYTIAILLIPLIILLTICYGLVQVLFNSLILWRGYRFIAKLPNFLEQADLLFKLVNFSLGVNFFQILGYPFKIIANFFAHFSINLSAVQVTCSGAQAPILLLVDIVIVGVVIIIIESGLQIYWVTALAQVFSKARNMIFSRYYAYHHFDSTMKYFVMSLFFALIPNPRKLVQYALGFVSALTFFAGDGVSRSSTNCNNAETIPVDAILGVTTTLLAIAMLAPVIYVLGQVLVPCFRREKVTAMLTSFLNEQMNDSSKNDEKKKNTDVVVAVVSGQEVSLSALQENMEKNQEKRKVAEVVHAAHTISEEELLFSAMTSHKAQQQQRNQNHSHSIDSTTSSSIRSSKKQLRQLDQYNDDDDSSDDDDAFDAQDDSDKAKTLLALKESSPEVQRMIQEGKKKSKTKTCLSWLLRVSSTFFSLDWLYIKFMSQLTGKLFCNYQSFCQEDHHAVLEKTSLKKKEGEDEDKAIATVEEDDRLVDIREEVTLATIPSMPWFFALSQMNTNNVQMQTDRAEEKLLWRQHKREFPSYAKMMMLVRQDLINSALLTSCSCSVRLKRYANLILACTPPYQLLSPQGWSIWLRVCKNYIVIFLISIGIWPDFVVTEFNLLGEYKKYRNLLNKVRDETLAVIEDRDGDVEMQEGSMRVGGDEEEEKKGSHDDSANNSPTSKKKKRSIHGSRRIRHSSTATASTEAQEAKNDKNIDAFAKIDNDDRFFFQSYVSAVVSSRVVLLQLIPPFTLWSVFAVELAQCPIMVFSDKMKDKLPPLLVMNPVQEARGLLEQDYKDKALVPKWKVFALAGYLFVRKSRAVNFAVIVFTNLVAVGLVFFPGDLRGLVVLLVIILFLVGFLTAMYILLLLHKLIFPADEEDQVEDLARASQANFAAEDVPRRTIVVNLIGNASAPAPSGNDDSSNTKAKRKLSLNTKHEGFFQEENPVQDAGGGISLSIIASRRTSNSHAVASPITVQGTEVPVVFGVDVTGRRDDAQESKML